LSFVAVVPIVVEDDGNGDTVAEDAAANEVAQAVEAAVEQVPGKPKMADAGEADEEEQDDDDDDDEDDSEEADDEEEDDEEAADDDDEDSGEDDDDEEEEDRGRSTLVGVRGVFL